jgi:hypothetical protein
MEHDAEQRSVPMLVVDLSDLNDKDVHESLVIVEQDLKKNKERIQQPTKKRLSSTTSKAASKPKMPAKSKIEKDFEKLTTAEQQAFLVKIGVKKASENNAPNPVETMSMVQSIHNTSVAAVPTKSVDEMEARELMNLRLELGDVLNREADLRAKEKKLRLAIKKGQRKLANKDENDVFGEDIFLFR